MQLTTEFGRPSTEVISEHGPALENIVHELIRRGYKVTVGKNGGEGDKLYSPERRFRNLRAGLLTY